MTAGETFALVREALQKIRDGAGTAREFRTGHIAGKPHIECDHFGCIAGRALAALMLIDLAGDAATVELFCATWFGDDWKNYEAGHKRRMHDGARNVLTVVAAHLKGERTP